MQNPDFETRCAILQTKANALNIELEPSLVDFSCKPCTHKHS